MKSPDSDRGSVMVLSAFIQTKRGALLIFADAEARSFGARKGFCRRSPGIVDQGQGRIEILDGEEEEPMRVNPGSASDVGKGPDLF